MITASIPGRGEYRLEHLALDMNGTIACDGLVLPGVADRLDQLSSSPNGLEITLLTADTHGGAARLAEELPVVLHRLETGREQSQKAEYVRRLGAQSTVAVGNGSNDAAMVAQAGLGICVLGSEGTAAETFTAADVVASDITVALDLLLHPQRLVATLRR